MCASRASRSRFPCHLSWVHLVWIGPSRQEKTAVPHVFVCVRRQAEGRDAVCARAISRLGRYRLRGNNKGGLRLREGREDEGRSL